VNVTFLSPENNRHKIVQVTIFTVTVPVPFGIDLWTINMGLLSSMYLLISVPLHRVDARSRCS
jgi:hypothetical protein